MNFLLFVGTLIFFIPAIIGKKSFSFIDLYLLFGFYFDVIDVYSDNIALLYLKHGAISIYLIYYYATSFSNIHSRSNKLFFPVVIFLTVLLFFPFFTEIGVSTVINNFIVDFSSYAILPIAFHYYSTKGNIKNLFIVIIVLILSLAASVLFFTIFGVDSNYIRPAGDLWWTSERTGGFLYFGNLGVRGVFVYAQYLLFVIVFFLLLKKRSAIPILQIIFYFSLIGFLVVFLVVGFKRLTLITVLFVFLYIVFNDIKYFNKQTVSFIIGGLALIFMLFVFTDVWNIFLSRTEMRGGADIFSHKELLGDIRRFEIMYVYDELKKSPEGLLFGRGLGRTISVYSDHHMLGEWNIHNSYAQIMFRYGLIGLLSYLYIWFRLYVSTKTNHAELLKCLSANQIMKKELKTYWLFFVVVLLLFIMSGFSTAHFIFMNRAISFMLLAGISGAIKKSLGNYKLAH